MANDLVVRLEHMAKLLGVGSFDLPALFREAAAALKAAEAETKGWLRIVAEIAAQVPIPEVLKATGTTGDMVVWLKQQLADLTAARTRIAELEKGLREIEKSAGTWPAAVARSLLSEQAEP